MKATPSRRLAIVVVLLVAAVAGALLRIFSAPESTLYFVGTLFMVLWLPVVGNVIAYLVRKFRQRARARSSFATPFVPQLVVELHLHAQAGFDQPRKEQDGRIHGLLVIGTEGFSVRVSLREGDATDQALGAEVQFLFPKAALAKFPVGTTFQLVQGSSGIGRGRVISLSPAT